MNRYARQLSLPDFGPEKQKLLSQAKVLIIGCGGLGNPVGLYLAGAGIGHVGLIDADTLAIDNLQRQVAFTEKDLGKPKAALLREKLENLNSKIKIRDYNFLLDPSNAQKLISQYQVIIDCTDNFAARYLINDACVLEKKPFVSGAIFRWEGHLGVFNHEGSGTYRDLFPDAPPAHLAPSCATGGLIGPMAGTIGTLQVLECIKLLIKKPLTSINSLLIIDGETLLFQKIKYKKTASPITKLNGKEYFKINEINYTEITPNDFLCIDIRTESEIEESPSGFKAIAPQLINRFLEDEKSQKKIVFCCASGKRSSSLLRELPFNSNYYSLAGGLASIKD